MPSFDTALRGSSCGAAQPPSTTLDEALARVPGSPKCFTCRKRRPTSKGVINLRGKVIPVVDLRLKLGLPEQEYTQRTCVIVVQVRGQAGPLLMSIVVDGVAEVLNLAAADIEDTPDSGDGTATPYLLGMAKVKDKVKILLEIDRVLASQELHALNALVH